MNCIVYARLSLLAFCVLVFVILSAWIAVFKNRKRSNRPEFIVFALIVTALGIFDSYTIFFQVSADERLFRKECYLQPKSTHAEYKEKQFLIGREPAPTEPKALPEKQEISAVPVELESTNSASSQ